MKPANSSILTIDDGPGSNKMSRSVETAGMISTDASRATVRVIQTDEDPMIARSVRGIPGLDMAAARSETKGTL